MAATQTIDKTMGTVDTFELSDRVRKLKGSATMAVSARVVQLRAKGVDVVSFGVGEPDFDTPEHIKQAAVDALMAGKTRYTAVAGEPAAREAVANKLRTENNIHCKADDVVITVGAKHALYMALHCLLNDGGGQEVILPTPAWVSYQPIIELAGGMAKQVPGAMENDFKMTPEQLEKAITKRTRAMIFNSPSNPCGTVYSPSEVRALAAVLAKHPQIVVVSDEIYEKLIFGDTKYTSIGSVDSIADRVVTVNGMSKAFAMTGWRVGYAAISENGCRTAGGDSMIKAMIRLQGQMTSNITSFVYPAIVSALTDPKSPIAVEEIRRKFERRGTLIYGHMQKLRAMPCPKPTGAFYVFPDISAHLGKTSPGSVRIENSIAFATALLEETGVAVVPGDEFGDCAAKHVRLSYACSDDRINAGCERLGKWLDALK